MKILIIGDVVGNAAVEYLKTKLRKVKGKLVGADSPFFSHVYDLVDGDDGDAASVKVEESVGDLIEFRILTHLAGDFASSAADAAFFLCGKDYRAGGGALACDEI